MVFEIEPGAILCDFTRPRVETDRNSPDLNHLLSPAARSTSLLALLLWLSGSNAGSPWECVADAQGKGWVCVPAVETHLRAGSQPSTPSPTLPQQGRGSGAFPPGEKSRDGGEKPDPDAEPVTSSPTLSPQGGGSGTFPPEEESGAGGEKPEPGAKAPAPSPASSPEGEARDGGEKQKPAAPSPPLPLQEEQSSSLLPDLDQEIDWNRCGPVQPAPVIIPDQPRSIVIEADGAEYLPREQIARFRGNVVIRQPGQTLYADDLQYDHEKGLVKVDERLLLQLRDLHLLGREGHYDLNKTEGNLQQVEYRILSRKARGSAEQVEIIDPLHSRYRNLSFTTCPPGNDGFLLQAEQVEIDQQRQVAHFEGTRLRFLGVPLFYLPRLTVPLVDQRQSGLLLPSLGYSSRNGLDLSLPYYFNLAPNYDATLVPRLISERGLLLGGEFRFLQPRHHGELRAEVLPDDRLFDQGSSTRGAVHARTRSQLQPDLAAELDINWVSDEQYLEDLGDSLAVSSTRHLRSRAALSWRQPDWDLLGEFLHYQTLDESLTEEQRPYSLLPRVAFNWLRYDGPAGLDYRVQAEFANFQRDTGVTGQRLHLEPAVSLPLGSSWWFVEPALVGRFTSYSLKDQLPGLDDNPDRALYSLSLDSGLLFDRPASWFGRRLTHTLEPRAYYLYTPYENQSELPLFDTSELDFTFNNLFRDDRFNGPDRVGDANQLTLALTSRMISDASGVELLRASIGQIFYFDDRRVQLQDDEPAERSSSSIIAELATGLLQHWQLRAAVEVDPDRDSDQLRQGLALATYRGEATQRFHAGWRLREGELEHTDFAAAWPVSHNLRLIGRWYYSLEENRTLETVAGLEYGDCCWRIRTLLRRYLESSGSEYNTTALIQLELTGLGALGNDIDNFLDRTIYGY